ncbi:peptidase C14, caspase catalytic subunit p20 [Nitrobacter winogradskyi Nb-255]|uniref:Peptidase C14, caspase catalytic subunit p20 n=1 Tax=Nitrobacter winogradskyi (strain ATCC 25391 / DSM 10237 / CIP 104748 / NCIMB 11846 / Nb-255) TaxID=323098 RepID=Q3SN55_NITWN|nr:caspase family protein [Nitrobacter winogradskyi]ABA06286.1 peptidase C14, caspase catalytic subunit p20 [Nitrobacter winogradskyi Nb-255]
MTLGQFRVSHRSVMLAAVLVGMVSLAIGAHAALNKRSLEVAKALEAEDTTGSIAVKRARVALVIGNGHYPDANQPLRQSINDARAFAAVLRRDGFDVIMVEDADKEDMHRAVRRLQAKIGPDTTALLFFSGFGIQSGRESYMIPVDARIWRESDVRRDGLSIETVLRAMKEHAAKVKLAVIDASRRNPYERRFRSYSHGLAPINVPDNALILSSATPGRVVDESGGQYSPLMVELLKSFGQPDRDAETVFSRTRAAVSRASEGKQVPTVSSSLVQDVPFKPDTAAASRKDTAAID